VAIGLLVGAGLALLFAPQLGRDTRRNLRRGLRRAGLRGHDAWDDLRLELRRARRQLKRARRARQVNLEERELAEP
jgi:gas vesicle protein